MPELWVPGASGPSVEDFVARLLRSIESFRVRRELDQVSVTVRLHDGASFLVREIRAEPGYGMVTLCPMPEDEALTTGKGGEACTAEELIVPVGSIMRLTLAPPEPQARFGFSVPPNV